METIKVHGGRAHFDDYISCCLVLATRDVDEIIRGKVDEWDLNDEHVYVLDHGRKLNPELNNYDHHQHNERCCTITYVLQHVVGVNIEEARKYLPWLYFNEVFDSQGPLEAAKVAGTTREVLSTLRSPIDENVIRLFSEMDKIRENHWLFQMMKYTGQKIIDKINLMKKAEDILAKRNISVYCGDVRLADFTDIDSEELWLAIRDTIVRNKIGIDVYLLPSRRNKDTYRLERNENNVRNNFSKITGPDIVFAHSNGFLIDFKNKDIFENLIKQSLV